MTEKSSYKPSNPDLCQMIIDILNRHRVERKEGGWAWRNIQPGFYFELLASAVKFSEGIPKHEERLIVGKSSSLANNQGPISIASLMREVSKQEQLFLHKPLQNFVIVTSVSLQNSMVLPKRRLGSTTLIFHSEVPVRYEHSGQIEKSLRKKTETPPNGYTAVTLHSVGRDVTGAFNDAMDSLDLLRGIWNWLLSLKYPIWRLTSQTQPFNQIRSGPFHTAHLANGKSAAGAYWYEPNIQERTLEPTDLKEEIWNEIVTDEKHVRKALRRSADGISLGNIIRDYARILDSCDHDAAFLGLWRLLEQLTLKNGEQGSKDRIPRRVSFLFQDAAFVREAVRFLNKYRDSSVHKGEGNPRINILIEKLRLYVDNMIRYHLEQAGRNRTLDDSIDLLCLSPLADQLKKEIEIRKRALRFRVA